MSDSFIYDHSRYDKEHISDPSQYVLKNRILSYRYVNCMSQYRLAFLCGVSKQSISDWEKNKYQPNSFVVPFLLQYLHCTFEELFYLERVRW